MSEPHVSNFQDLFLNVSTQKCIQSCLQVQFIKRTKIGTGGKRCDCDIRRNSLRGTSCTMHSVLPPSSVTAALLHHDVHHRHPLDQLCYETSV